VIHIPIAAAVASPNSSCPLAQAAGSSVPADPDRDSCSTHAEVDDSGGRATSREQWVPAMEHPTTIAMPQYRVETESRYAADLVAQHPLTISVPMTANLPLL
jgi:hypothetical protein